MLTWRSFEQLSLVVTHFFSYIMILYFVKTPCDRCLRASKFHFIVQQYVSYSFSEICMMEYQETPTGTLEIVSDPSQFGSFIHSGRNRGIGGGNPGPGHRGGASFNKPWISESIKTEIWKKKKLSEAVRRTKSASDVAALEKQTELVESLIRFNLFKLLVICY